MTIAEYLEKINTRFKTGISREHTYRGDLQNLLESLVTDVLVTNNGDGQDNERDRWGRD